MCVHAQVKLNRKAEEKKAKYEKAVENNSRIIEQNTAAATESTTVWNAFDCNDAPGWYKSAFFYNKLSCLVNRPISLSVWGSYLAGVGLPSAQFVENIVCSMLITLAVLCMSCSIAGIGAFSLPPAVQMGGAIVAAVEADVEKVRQQQRNDVVWISQAEQELQKLLNNELSTEQVAHLLDNWMSEGRRKDIEPISIAHSSAFPICSSGQTPQAQEAAEDVVSATGRRCAGQVDSVALDLEMANSAVGLIVCHGQNCFAYRRPFGLQVDYVEWPCTP